MGESTCYRIHGCRGWIKSKDELADRAEPNPFLNGNGWNKSSLKIDMDICVEGFPAKSGEHKFGSTSVTIKTSGTVLKTPPGMWAQDAMNQIAAARGTPVNTPPVDIPYTDKTSCSKRT